MKYMVFTAKHHDGFCMFGTKQTDYDIMHSPFGRNVVKELAAACRKQGVSVQGPTIQSVMDWHHPGFTAQHTGPAARVSNPIRISTAMRNTCAINSRS